MQDLKDKVILITGGTSGLGRAVAIQLGALGARVAITGRRADKGEAVANEITAAGGEGHFIRADITQRSDVERMVSDTLARFGRLDGAVNNAGVAGPAFKPAADITEEEWMGVINTNLNAVWMSLKYEIPALLEAGGGSVVNVASIYGGKGSDIGHSPYAASKFGVVGLTKSAAIDYGQNNIRVNAVCPGYFRSEMVEPDTEGLEEFFKHVSARHSAMNRVAETDEVANAVVWLLSSHASFVNGTAMQVDGGETSKLY